MRAFEGQQAGVGADSEADAGRHGVHLRRLEDLAQRQGRAGTQLPPRRGVGVVDLDGVAADGHQVRSVAVAVDDRRAIDVLSSDLEGERRRGGIAELRRRQRDPVDASLAGRRVDGEPDAASGAALRI